MKILYFGKYDPEYSRNRVIIKGLKENSVEVNECVVDSGGFLKIPLLLWKYLKISKDFNVMIVGFPGQETMFLARFLTKKPIIFDAFTSHYGGYILDRKKYSEKSIVAKYYKLLDRWSCKLADLVLLDTQAHIDFFVKEFGLPSKKFLRVFVGTDPNIFYPKELNKADKRFIVHFHGNYIPLQGVKYIIEAAKLLEKEDITFNLIGRGQTYKDDIKLAERLGVNNISFIERVPYGDLSDYMARADICLGIFGLSPKTSLVIPNKIFEAMAMGKPIITAKTTAIEELLKDNESVIFCLAGDAKSLADKILYLKNNSLLCGEIGKRGREVYLAKAQPSLVVKELTKLINERFN